MIINSEYGTTGAVTDDIPSHLYIYGIDINNEYFSDDMYSWYERRAAEDYTEEYMKHGGHDMYLFVDVLEHFKRDKAVEIILWLREDNRKIIAAIPNAPNHWEQSPEFEAANPHEAHLHNWTNEEVERDLGLRFVGENDGVGVFAHGV